MSRIIKVAGVLLLLLLILVVPALYFLLQSEALNGWVRNQIVSQLESRFALRVELDRVDLRLFENRVELLGFRIHNRDFPSPDPVIDIDRILLEYSITSFIRPSGSLDHLQLTAPRIRILQDPNERLNISNVFRRIDEVPEEEAEDARLELTPLAIGRIRVERGLFVFHDSPIQLESMEGALNARLLFDRARGHYRGDAELREFDLRVDGFALHRSDVVLSFELDDDELALPSVSFESEGVEARVAGQLTFSETLYRFDTAARVDLRALPEPDLRDVFEEGQVELSGTFSGRGGEFEFDGSVSSSHVRLASLSFRQLQSAFFITPESVQVERLTCHLHSGLVHARGELFFEEDALSRFHVNAGKVGIHPLLTDLGQGQILARGLGSFEGEVQWPGLQWERMTGQGLSHFSGSFSTHPPPSGEEPTGIPFEGVTEVAFDEGTVRLAGGSLQTLRSDVLFEGEVDFDARYSFQAQVESEQGQELLQIARLAGFEIPDLESEYFLTLPGPALVEAAIGGDGEDFRIAADFSLQDVHLSGDRLGNLKGHAEVDDASLAVRDILLQGLDFSIDGSFDYAWGEEPGEPALSANLREVPLERFLVLLEDPPEIEGRVSGSAYLEAFGEGRYRGRGNLALTALTVYGETIEGAEFNWELVGDEVVIEDLEARLASGTVTGEGAYLIESGRFQVSAAGRDLRLEQFQAVREQAPVEGRLRFDLKGRGTPQAPSFEIEALVPTLQMGEVVLDDLRLRTTAEDGKARFRLSHSFKNQPFELEGVLGLEDPYLIEAHAEVTELPLGPFLELMELESLPKVDGRLSGTLNVAGPLTDLESLTGRAELSRLHLVLDEYPIETVDTLRATYRNGTLRLEPVTIEGLETRLLLSGDFGLIEPRTVNLRLDGKVNLEVARTFFPEASASGELTLETVVSGPLTDPRIAGSAELEDGVLIHPDLPTSLQEARGSFKFTANQVSIDTMSVRTRYGVVNAEGGIFLDSFQPTQWRINVYGSGLRLEYPDDLHTILDVDLDLLKSERSQMISGAVYVRSAEYTEHVSLPDLIFQATTGEPVSTGISEEEIVLDISVQAYQTLRVSNNLADIVASGEFTLRGTLDNPVVLGHVTIDEGQLFFENNVYEVTRGTINFNDPRRILPVFNFEAQTDIREFTVTIGVRGPVEKLNVSFRSDPPLPTPSIISLLAVGETQEYFEQREAGTLAMYGAGALLTRTVGERLETRTARLFGFERFSIDPFLDQGRDTGARITLGKQLTQNLAVTFVNEVLNNQQGQKVILEYQLARWLTAIGTRETDGSVAVDFRFKNRF